MIFEVFAEREFGIQRGLENAEITKIKQDSETKDSSTLIVNLREDREAAAFPNQSWKLFVHKTTTIIIANHH